MTLNTQFKRAVRMKKKLMTTRTH